MGVYIRDMEKPKDSCWDCKAQYNSVCSLKREHIKWDGILDDCPLIEIDIVRCGECKYYEESEYIEGDMACKYHIGHTYYTEADRFCYYGERNSKNNSNQI